MFIRDFIDGKIFNNVIVNIGYFSVISSFYSIALLAILMRCGEDHVNDQCHIDMVRKTMYGWSSIGLFFALIFLRSTIHAVESGSALQYNPRE